MNLPNLLTVFRIILAIIFIYLFPQSGLMPIILGIVVFTVASLTDCLDGYLARKHNLITPFGKIMDPIADKLLILSAFFMFMQAHIITAWVFIVIAAREVIVTVLRLRVMHKGAALAAEKAGKLKTVLQIVAVYLIMIYILCVQMNIGAEAYEMMMNGIQGMMLLVVGITLWSGISFLVNNRKELFRV